MRVENDNWRCFQPRGRSGVRSWTSTGGRLPLPPAERERKKAEPLESPAGRYIDATGE
jgi:hypothetical protein